MNVTDAFVAYLTDKGAGSLPEAVLEQAASCCVDYLGAACAGYHTLETRLACYLSVMPEGPARILGADRGTDGLSAAFTNGFAAHVLELDDGHRFGMIHLAAPVISAVLSAAQMERVSWDAMLRGVVMGYEAAARLAMSMQPEHKRRGFHASGICGTVGAAVGVAFVLGLPAAQLKSALCAAGTSAAGLLEIQEDRSELKPYNVGHAAMSGLNATLMARTGFGAPEDFFGGRRGFVRVLTGSFDPDKLLEKTDYYEIQRVYLKPYAACRHSHSAVEAALFLRDKLPPEAVEAIAVDIYGLAIAGHDHREIRSAASAKLSIPYSVAAAYILGHCDYGAFAREALGDRRILALAQRVEVREDPALTALCPARRAARVTVRGRGGENLSHQVDYARGEPENPLTQEDIERKFLALMAVSGREWQVEPLLRAVARGDMEAFLSHL